MVFIPLFCWLTNFVFYILERSVLYRICAVVLTPYLNTTVDKKILCWWVTLFLIAKSNSVWPALVLNWNRTRVP
jgi:uncharacterized membrane protein (DUF106 family)